MIIERPKELKKINEINKWILVYGRRKTGKTFLVKNFVKYDEYLFVKTNKNIMNNKNEAISYETFIEILKRLLENNKTVIVDEFHRLGNDFFDFLHYTKKQGKLILISSTLFLSKKLISSKSPLLGLFAEISFGLINIKDALNALNKFNFSKKEKIELAILFREPVAIDYFDERRKARDIISTVILSSIKTIPSLIGEIFLEEERELSGVYEGIIRGIAIGKIGSGKISNYLFSKKLIKKDDPSVIQQYLNNLVYFGIIKKIEIFNKKRFAYKLISPLSKIYYYADEKYNLSERKINDHELALIIDELMPRLVEDNIREFIAEKNGLKESIIEAKDFDIDACLLRFKRPETILEIKWGNLNKNDILKIESNLNKIKTKNKYIFVQDKNEIKSNLKILDVEDL